MLSFVHSFRDWVNFNGGNSNMREFRWIKIVKVFDLMSTNVNKPHFIVHGIHGFQQQKLTWEDEQPTRRTRRMSMAAMREMPPLTRGALARIRRPNYTHQKDGVKFFGKGIGLLLIMRRSGWTWGWNAGCEEVMQQQLISDVYHAWVVFKVGKTVENITPNIHSFIWRERWAVSELCLTLITRRVINTQTIRPL